MKAVHVIQRYTPAVLTGSEKALAILCTALAKTKQLETVVITSNVDAGWGFYDPRSPRFAAGEAKVEGVRVIRLPVNWFLGSFYYLANRLLSLIGIRWASLRFKAFGPQLAGLESTIVAEKPDLLHILPMPMSQTYAAWQIARRHHIPFVVTPTMHFDDPMFDNPLIYTILKEADAVIAHTEFEKATLAKKGIDKHKITVIPSSYLTDEDFAAVSVTAFNKEHDLKPDQPVILFLGSKSFDKGVNHLAEAWPTIRQAVPEARLILAGGPTSSWNEQRKTSNLTGVIEFGYVSDELKQQLLARCQIVCQPSRAESFGMILLESWAKGKAFIGGSAGATRELITEGVNGYTVNFGDTKAIATKLIELLTDEKKRKQFGQAGQTEAKRFTEQQIVDRTLEVYRTIRQGGDHEATTR